MNSAEQFEEDGYGVAREIAARHWSGNVPTRLRRKGAWTEGDVQTALGLSPEEFEGLWATKCLFRYEPEGGPRETRRDDIFDLLGIRWSLPGDTAADYKARCKRAGVAPDRSVKAGLLGGNP